MKEFAFVFCTTFINVKTNCGHFEYLSDVILLFAKKKSYLLIVVGYRGAKNG